ncbi:Pre-mRNA-splicing factor [Wickerhamomyces ciferrii]|uniref:DNA damage-binding protein 1 n=1 Tax=Wickerhamomyces ciferrii (strain ATCC 14091 / BCRC 22168 / CBS 111 / JCM 3599 / NBRC 0793 / NRRL Y-1031 F-60-10) TaxID=1206466 RepID=K0KYJ9_WICCF|nr:Pre-mRNA-splicing factor [Wickerhamomyces ciferrii]CCH46158.1 Pre-mRNA-splicing factor [Wickerhamomyces ciferrii]
MSIESPLHLYNLTLQRQSNSLKSCVGNFSGKKTQEIITATSNSLIVYKPNVETGKLVNLLNVQIFAIIRSMENFKIAGSGKDYLAITSDSGNFSILELDLNNGKFNTLFNEPYHKSGIRRLSPGQDLAVDPKGRAILATAIEKNKLCYVFNRDLDNNLTISSPLEANRSKILTLTSIGLDVGYENPVFATIEIDYSNYEYIENLTEVERFLTFYELDLGLNHIVRRKTEKIHDSSNLLLQVPGGNDGPSGVLVCSKNLISYRNLIGDKVSINIPKLENSSNQDSFIVAGVVHKMKNQFFFIVQTNHGDLFKIELLEEGSITISYFDTIPLASSIIILRSGFLYCDSEYGSKFFYQFEKLGSESPFISSNDEPIEELTFERTEELDNLLLVDVLDSLNPLIDSKLVNDDAFTKIYSLSGVKDSSSLKILQYGLSINEIVESDLPGIANKVWTTKLNKNDEFDKYLVISFMDTTLVLSIGENVEEITDSGLALNEETIGIQQIGINSLVQIHSNGIRNIKNGELINEWQPPAGIKILTTSTTNRQIAIGLSNDELVYFEVDDRDRLIEYNERKELTSRIVSLSLGDIPEGRLRSPFLIVGCQDSTIRVLSTDPGSTLELLSLQALSSIPFDILTLSMNNQLFVNIGLENGVYVRTLIDEQNGQLSDTRIKYLGNKPVSLSKISISGVNVVLAFSNKTWIVHETKNSTFKINSLLINPLKFGFMFNSEDCIDGIVGVYKKNLIIFTIDDLDNDFNINSIQLKTTPKNLLKNNQDIFITQNSSSLGFIEKFDQELELNKSIQLSESETIITSTIVKFESKSTSYLLVSISKKHDNGSNEFFINTYDLELNLIHITKISDIAYAITEFQGKVLIGISNHLRLFDMGLKQLLSKANSKIDTISKIVKIETQGYRVVVGDIRESITFLVYKPKSNEFLTFTDDILPRHITSIKMLDYNTVIGGDKFGNLFILRASEESSKISDTNSTFLITKDKFLNGAPFKLMNLCNFFIEDIPTSFAKGSFTIGGKDLIIYTGLQGTVGALIPLLTKSDIKFFINLEKQMRLHKPDLLGRMNLKYRGYYQPVKNVIDGDLIELFNTLSESTKVEISNELDKTPREISKKIDEIRFTSI